MKDPIQKLLSISSAGLCASAPANQRPSGAVAPSLVAELFRMLEQANGFYAFECALHVLPSNCADLINLEYWNSDSLWKSDYEAEVRNDFFFAEDIFGEQFALRGASIIRFDPETAEATPMGDSLAQWAQQILDDYEQETGYPWASEWQEKFGALPVGKRLQPKIPFILGGVYDVDNFYALDAVESMRYRASIWRQIKDMAPGTKVTLEVVGPDEP